MPMVLRSLLPSSREPFFTVSRGYVLKPSLGLGKQLHLPFILQQIELDLRAVPCLSSGTHSWVDSTDVKYDYNTRGLHGCLLSCELGGGYQYMLITLNIIMSTPGQVYKLSWRYPQIHQGVCTGWSWLIVKLYGQGHIYDIFQKLSSIVIVVGYNAFWRPQGPWEVQILVKKEELTLEGICNIHQCGGRGACHTMAFMKHYHPGSNLYQYPTEVGLLTEKMRGWEFIVSAMDGDRN